MQRRFVLAVTATALLVISYFIAQSSPILKSFVANIEPIAFSVGTAIVSLYTAKRYGIHGMIPACFVFFSVGATVWGFAEGA